MDSKHLLCQQWKDANDDDNDHGVDQDKARSIETGEDGFAGALRCPAIGGSLLAIGVVGTLVGVAFCLNGAIAYSKGYKTVSMAAVQQKNLRVEGDLLVITHEEGVNRLPDNKEDLMALIKDEASVSPGDVTRITDEMETPDRGSLASRVMENDILIGNKRQGSLASAPKKKSEASVPKSLVELNGVEVVSAGAGDALVKDKTCVQWTDAPPEHKVKVCGYKFNTFWTQVCQDDRADRPGWMTVDGCHGCREFSTTDKYNFGIVQYYSITECPK